MGQPGRRGGTRNPAQAADIERRLASFEHDRAGSVTWKQLKAELANRNP
jgi:hypothetical protein